MLIRPLLQHVGRRQCLVADGVEDGEVAAGLGPLVVLFGQHRAHQAPRRQPVGEDTRHVPFRGQALRRRNSRFSRSCGLLDHSFCQWATGKAVKARMSGAASASSSATWGKGSRSCSTTRSIGRGPRRETVAGGWWVPWWPRRPFDKLRRARLGTRVSRLAMTWVRQRCQLAPVNTAAMAFFNPPAFAGAGSGEHRRLPVPPR